MTSVRALLVTLLIFTAACGGKSTTSPSTTLPSTYTFTAQLLPGNETPPITNADASASGTATITVNVTRDSAGAITAATVSFQVNMTGFPANTTITAAHIHEAAAGVAGGVKISTGLANGEVALNNGAGSFQKTNITGPADVVQGMVNNPAGYYFNVHTALNLNGAIRGQLVKQ